MSMDTDWTPDRIRDAARDHVAYGWTKRPGGHSGRTWNEEDHRIYNEEYDRFHAIFYPEAQRHGGLSVIRS